jgi:hypothetical protein
MSVVSIDPLLAFGTVCIGAAIIGGGLKALNVEMPVIASGFRQVLLALFGLILVAASQHETLRRLLHPTITDRFESMVLEAGRALSETVDMGVDGRVGVTVHGLRQDYSGFVGEHGAPGHDGLHVTICGQSELGPCPSIQVADNGTFARELKEGTATISFFNFADSPRKTFSVSVSHPRP